MVNKSNKSEIMEKYEWIEQAAKFYFQIFSTEYDAKFINELLKGGGGNSILCGSWMKISNNFMKYRISESSLKRLNEIKFPYIKEDSLVNINWSDINSQKKLFYNNAKTIENRKKVGKLFHFDHHPSNKKILLLLKEKVNELSKEDSSYESKIEQFSNFIKSIQTVDLITIEQDFVRTTADLKSLLSKEERDSLLKGKWYDLNLK